MTQIYEKMKPVGDIGEDKSIEYISRFPCCKIIYRAPSNIYFPYYDIIALNESNGVQKSIEVKTDRVNNNRAAIEFKQGGIPSGIQITLADIYYIYKQPHNAIYIIEVSKLKAIISQIDCLISICNNGNTECYMVDLSNFRKVDLE